MSGRIGRAMRSLQATIALALFSLVFLAVVAIEMLSYHLTERTVVRNSESYTRQLVEEAGRGLDSYVAYMTNISSVIKDNAAIERYFTEPGRPGEASIVNLLDSIKRTRSDVALIALFGRDGKIVSNRRGSKLAGAADPEELSWYRAAIRARGRPVISPSHLRTITQGQSGWVIALSREIISGRSGRPIAVLLVALNFDAVRSICTSIDLGKRGYVFIVDRDGAIIYHTQREQRASDSSRIWREKLLSTEGGNFVAGSGQNRRIYSTATSRETGWKIVGVSYMNTLLGDNRLVEVTYLALGGASLAIVILLSLLVSFRISRPVKLLTRSMEQVERGNFDVHVKVGTNDEIGRLGGTFNMMIARIRDLMEQNERVHEAKRRAELQALQAQINPHFLYNTLDSVIWAAESKRHEEVVTMVSSLAKLLRLSIGNGAEIVTIGEEIEQLRNYLVIQKIRYCDKLDYLVAVDEELYRSRIPRTLLQPLVENSIYHGIKEKKGGGTVEIVGRRTSDGLLIQVIDDGVGMEEAMVRSLLSGSSAAAGVESEGAGVGVRNVHERIQLYFGKAFGLSFRSAPGQGTTVEVRLPLLE